MTESDRNIKVILLTSPKMTISCGNEIHRHSFWYRTVLQKSDLVAEEITTYQVRSG